MAPAGEGGRARAAGGHINQVMSGGGTPGGARGAVLVLARAIIEALKL